MARFILITVILLLSRPAFSQSPDDFSPIEVRLKTCNNKHPDVQGNALCEEAAFSAADQRLNQVYAGVLEALRKEKSSFGSDDAEVIQRLVRAERAWIPFREAECDYKSSIAINHPLEGFYYQACRYELTKARIKTLTAPEAPQNFR